MKNTALSVVSFLLIATLWACQKPETFVVRPVTVPPVVTLPTPVPSNFPSFPGNYDFFASFPAVFPESARHRVAQIRVAAVGTEDVRVRALFWYSEQTGQLVSKSYRSGNSRIWQHNFTFDAQNRLVREESDNIKNSDDYTPIQIDYTYTNGLLTTINRKTAESRSISYSLNLLTRFRYDGTRRVSATIINYYVNGAGMINVPYPVDSVRRTYSYADNDRQITARDSAWHVPCYPNMPCINIFRGITVFQTRLNDRAGLEIAVLTPSDPWAPFYPLYPFMNNKPDPIEYQHKYDGPDGLIGSVTDATRGIVYRFVYELKP